VGNCVVIVEIERQDLQSQVFSVDVSYSQIPAVPPMDEVSLSACIMLAKNPRGISNTNERG
jgi:hypothetical protein